MSWRVILSIVLVAIGIGIMYVVDGLLGALLGSGVFIFMLMLWLVPPNMFERGAKRSQSTDPTVSKVSRILLGVGGGLILASLTAVFFPNAMSWLMIAVGIGIIVWFFISR